MQTVEALIIGAGPAGGQCARELSKAGRKVLLVERHKNFMVNNFSSAGAPLEILDNFALPARTVGTFWQNLVISTSHNKHVWQASRPIGVILDFMELRTFLANETVTHGGEVWMGWTYQDHETRNGDLFVSLKNERGTIATFLTNVLVDATGSERAVLAKQPPRGRQSILGRAIEYLVDVDPPTYQTYANSLSFFLGLKWMPQGYGWIFPMKSNHLKVGVGRNFIHDHFVPYEASFQFYLEQLMQECLKAKDWPILDRHGKTISYTYHQDDPHFNQRVIAIGDAISTVNPLAFEGIRHGMMSGRIAAKHILAFLGNGRSGFKAYPSEMQRYFGIKWRTCEFLTKKIYREVDDEKVDTMLIALKRLSFDEMTDLVFRYRLGKMVKFYVGYLFLIIKQTIKNVCIDSRK